MVANSLKIDTAIVLYIKKANATKLLFLYFPRFYYKIQYFNCWGWLFRPVCGSEYTLSTSNLLPSSSSSLLFLIWMLLFCVCVCTNIQRDTTLKDLTRIQDNRQNTLWRHVFPLPYAMHPFIQTTRHTDIPSDRDISRVYGWISSSYTLQRLLSKEDVDEKDEKLFHLLPSLKKKMKTDSLLKYLKRIRELNVVYISYMNRTSTIMLEWVLQLYALSLLPDCSNSINSTSFLLSFSFRIQICNAFNL